MMTASLQQLEWALPLRRRKGFAEFGKVELGEFDLERRAVLLHPRGRRGLRNHHHVAMPENPGEPDLRRRGTMADRDAGQYPIAQQSPLFEGRIGHDRDGALAAPGQKSSLDSASPQIVEHLIACARLPAGKAK